MNFKDEHRDRRCYHRGAEPGYRNLHFASVTFEACEGTAVAFAEAYSLCSARRD